MSDRREELLQKLVAAASEGGLGGRSLRELATAVGTSHRMLVHHFGSREGVLAAVVATVEAGQTALLAELPPDPAAAVRTVWARTREPSLWAVERLFFECYARGAQGEAPFDRLVPGLVEAPLAAVPPAPPGTDPVLHAAMARLGMAVIRGLLLDLVATGDREGTDRALEAFVSLLSADVPLSAASDPSEPS